MNNVKKQNENNKTKITFNYNMDFSAFSGSTGILIFYFFNNLGKMEKEEIFKKSKINFFNKTVKKNQLKINKTKTPTDQVKNILSEKNNNEILRLAK